MILDRDSLARKISELIDMADQAGQGVLPWMDFTRSLVEVVPGSIGAFLRSSYNPAPDNLVHHGYDPDLLQAYNDHFGSLNPWNGFWHAATIGTVYPSARTFPSRSFRHTEFYNDWLMKLDGHADGIGIKLAAGGDTILSIVLHLPDKQLQEAEDIYDPVLSGISGALIRAVSRSLAKEDTVQKALAQASLIDRDPDMALVIDAYLNIVDANAPAETSFREGDIVASRSSKLFIASGQAHEWLRKAIRAMSSRQPWADHRLIAVAAGKLCRFTVLPLSSAPSTIGASPFRRSLFLLAIRRLDRERPLDLGLFSRYFRLSPAEAKMCELLAGGRTVNEAADALNITRESARDRLKQIFRKTDVGRQTDLVTLLLKMN